MSSTQKRYPNRAARRKAMAGIGAANRLGTRTPIIPTLSKASGADVTITFDGPVSLKGLPAYEDNAGTPHVVTAAELTAPNVLELTLNGNASTTLTIPFEDPAVRNNAGGYVQPGTYTFPS